MSNNTFASIGKLAIAFILLVMIAVGGGTCWVISTMNSEVSLRNRVLAQQDTCKADFDKMWKVIAQKAQVSEQYRDSFKEIYPQLIAGRYGDGRGGSLMKWIQESNPNFDTSLYKDLMASIEGQREGFFRNQKLLIDMKREHDTLLQSFPASAILAGRESVEIELILSDKTDAAYQTGQENDVTLPGSKKP